MDGLKLLASAYSEDDSTEYKTVNETCKAVHKLDVENSLPLPGAIVSLYDDGNESSVSQQKQHSGRIRSFPHVRGNWATHVYVSIEPENKFVLLLQNLVKRLEKLTRKKWHYTDSEDLHVSVSRTVVLCHHWLEDFRQSLKEKLQTVLSFSISFGGVAVYTNEEKTRTFVGLDVEAGVQNLQKISSCADRVMEEFRQKTFYQNPSFHMSFAWALGDVSTSITQAWKSQLNDVLHNCTESDLDSLSYWISKVTCKTGNKTSFILLSAS